MRLSEGVAEEWWRRSEMRGSSAVAGRERHERERERGNDTRGSGGAGVRREGVVARRVRRESMVK